MPGCSRLSIDRVVAVAQEAEQLGICCVALFPCVPDEKKTKRAEERYVCVLPLSSSCREFGYGLNRGQHESGRVAAACNTRAGSSDQ